MVGVFQSHTVALDGTHHLLNRFVLSNDVLFQFLRHTFQSDAFLLCHTLHGNTRHHRHHILYLLFRHRLAVVDISFLPFAVHFRQLTLYHGLAVAESGCQFKVLVLDGKLLLLNDLFQILFKRSNLRWQVDILKMYARAHLIHRVDSLIGLLAVADVTVCQFDTCRQGIVRVADVVVLFVAVLDVMQDLQRLFCIGGFNKYFLETALQGSVLLNRVTVFVQRRGTDALYRASCQSWLQDVCSIH